MFRNYFKTALRNMRRNKLFTGLNIFGLATGLACSILIFLWVQDELSYDKFNPGAEKIFRLTSRITNTDAAVVPGPFSEAIKEEIPGIALTTRIKTDEKVVTIGTRKFNEKHLYYADTNFLRMFNYPLLAGNTANVLLGPNDVVLTEATAIKYFGNAGAAMGKSIFVDNDIKGSGFRVTGILKNVPANSHLQFDLLLPIQNYDRMMSKTEAWNNFNYYVYFRLADAVKADAATVQMVEKQINAIRNKIITGSNAVPAVISAQRLTDVHLHSNLMLDVDGQGNIQYVRIFMVVAIFIIFIACINFMNLATALSGTRAKEVGLRKTIGALRWQLTGQFIGESMLLSFLSLIVALGLVFIALPFFNTLASKSILLDLYDPLLVGKIIGITVLAGLLAGIYPAFYLSSFNAIKVLKGSMILKGRGSFLRNGLVVLQFSISVILMISTVVVYNQLNFIHNRDIGFNKENLLYINLPEVGDLKDNTDAVKAALHASSGIGDFSIAQNLPTDLTGGTQITWRGMEKGEQLIIYKLGVDEDFLKTFGMKMVAGHFFSRDYKGGDSAFVVNETAVRAMKMDPENAVGRIIHVSGRDGVIMGIVKDFNFKPVFHRIEPLVMRRKESGDFLVIRTAPGSFQKTLATVKSCFQRIYGENPFTYGFVDQDLDHLYTAESRMSRLFNVFSALSIIISCLGLFGLATFSTQRRTKEIGVRKVLGAGEAGIVALLAKEFLRLVALSLLVAFPVAWYVMNQWLRGFVYRVNISAWVFVAAGVAALLVAFVTVSYQTIRAAMANPTRSLRSE
ncbi:MAG TPA: ABC transporter permease [Puia sp.]|jgi:ABC-type antimicrobial peptide transport system permease subunit